MSQLAHDAMCLVDFPLNAKMPIAVPVAAKRPQQAFIAMVSNVSGHPFLSLTGLGNFHSGGLC